MAEKKGEGTSPKTSEAKPNVNYVENPFPVEEVFVDGVAGIFGRGGVFKVDCYSALGHDPKTNTETRRITRRFVLPGSAMAELIKAVQGVMKSAETASHDTSGQTPPREGLN